MSANPKPSELAKGIALAVDEWWSACALSDKKLRALVYVISNAGLADLEAERDMYKRHAAQEMGEQVRKEEGGGTARRVRSAKTSGSRALLKRAYYRQGLQHALEAIENLCRGWECNLEQRHYLVGQPKDRHGYPLIRESAEIARMRLSLTAEIERMIDASLATEPEGEGGNENAEG